MKRNIMRVLVLSLLGVYMAGVQSFAATISQSNDIGWKSESNTWRYYTTSNQAVKEWLSDNGSWYYLDTMTGNMKTGWFQDAKGDWYFFNTLHANDTRNIQKFPKGKLLTGWQWIDGKCYYLKESGADIGRLFVDTSTPDGYKVNQNGEWLGANDEVVIIQNKGLPSSEGRASLAKSTATRRSSSGGGGSSSSGRTSSGVSTSNLKKEETPVPKEEVSSDTKEPVEIGEDTKDNEQTVPVDEKKEVKVISYKKIRDKEIEYLGDDIAAYKSKLPAYVSLILDNGKYLTAMVESWETDHSIKAGQEVSLIAKIILPVGYEYLEENLPEVSMNIRIKESSTDTIKDADLVPDTGGGSDTPGEGDTGKKDDEKKDDGEETEVPDTDATVESYQAFADMEMDYIDNSISSYSVNFPKEVVYNLSNGKQLRLSISSWSFEQRPRAGEKVRVKALVDLPSEYNYLLESFENISVYMNLHLRAVTTELELEWDKTVDTGYGGKKHEYQYTENPVITLKNYTGDGSDITVRTGTWGSYVDLSVGNGLSYDAQNKSITISSEKVLEKGFKTTVNTKITVGAKTFTEYITYKTDREIVFKDNTSSYSKTSVKIGNISRKRDFWTELEMSAITPEEYNDIRYMAGDNNISHLIHIIEQEGKTYMRIAYNDIKDYLASSFGEDSLRFTMRLKGLEEKSVQLTYMAAPKLSPDKTNGYYAKQNPVLTLQNFEEAFSEDKHIHIRGEGIDRELTIGTDYIWNAEAKTVTLQSQSILQADTLAADKRLQISARIGSDEASSEILYKKDKALVVADVRDLAPYSNPTVRVSGIESSETTADLGIYHGTSKLEIPRHNYKRDYNTGDVLVELSYAMIQSYIQENRVALTAKYPGVNDVSFNLEYITVSESGASAPIGVSLVNQYGEAYELQDGMPKFLKGGSIVLEIKDRSITEDTWKKMGISVQRKGDASSEFAVGIQGFNRDYSGEAPFPIKSISTTALYNYSDLVGTVEKNTEGKWPTYTVNIYMAGYAKTSFDVVLYAPSYE